MGTKVIRVDPENSKLAHLGSLGTFYIKWEIQTSLTPVISNGMTFHQAILLKRPSLSPEQIDFTMMESY